MSHLISSHHKLALATDCMGSGMELPDAGLTWTHLFFKVLVMCLAFRYNLGSTGLWRGENKTTSVLGSPWEASGDIFLVPCSPHVSAPLVPGKRSYLYVFLVKVEELPNAPVGASCWDLSCVLWYSGECPHFMVFGFGSRHFWQK